MAKLTSIINVVLDANGIITFDNGIETDFQVPLSMVESNSAQLYRTLRQRGWVLDGISAGFRSRKAEAVAGHIQSMIGNSENTINDVGPVYWVPTEGVTLPAIPPAPATFSFSISGTAAGDGDLGFSVTGGLGGPYTISPPAAQGTLDSVIALVAAIDAGADYDATNNGIFINCTDKTPGLGGNAKVIVYIDTETGQDLTSLTQPQGGHDGAPGETIGISDEPQVALGFDGVYFVCPYSWVTGDSASIRRELAKLGFSIGGSSTMIGRKADLLAAHISAELEIF